MLTIPVLDLSQGIVVHAIQGKRDQYQPISSNICISSHPLEVINGLLKVFDFKSFYIADLDALEHLDNHINTIESICHTFPDVEFWLDTGFLLIKHYLNRSKLENLRIILSSESLPSIDAFSSTLKQYHNHNFILSLDYKSDHLIGLQELLQYKEQWPKDVIILNLHSVGSEQGFQFPSDLNKIELINNFNIFYGGGIRNISEMESLKSIGCAGALISTSLHKQSIEPNDILQLNQ